VLAGVGHHRGDEGIGAGGELQGRLLVERVGDEVGQRDEEGVGDRVVGVPVDWPPQPVQEHLALSGEAARMRTRSLGWTMSSGRKNAEAVCTGGRTVVWWVSPAGIQTACCGGSR
jgi:hypothetical protein